MEAAQKDVDEATKALKTLEEEIIDGQAASSDFGKLRDEFRAAEKKYQDARKSVLDSDDFKDPAGSARKADDSATAVPALKKEFDAMPEIADPRAKLQEIKERYEPARTELLEADSKWADADKDLKAKKETLDDVKHKFTEANLAANKAKPPPPRPRPPPRLLPRPRLPRMRSRRRRTGTGVVKPSEMLPSPLGRGSAP